MASKAYPKIDEILSESERSSKLLSFILYHDISKDTVDNLYGEEAQQYEELCEKLEYQGPFIGTRIFVGYLEQLFNKECNILDLGAGTGMCGKILNNAGYTNMTAVDISDQMLEEAKKKNIYKSVVQKDLNRDSLEEFDGLFDAVICIGVFYYGQVESGAIDKAWKVLKPGGIICFSIRNDLYDQEGSGYKDRCESLVKEGKWKQLSCETSPLVAKMDSMGYYFTFQRST